MKEEFYNFLETIVLEFSKDNEENNFYEVLQYNIKDPVFLRCLF